MNSRMLIVVGALVALLPSGCASQQPSEAENCVGPLEFEDRTYVWTPAGNEYVTPGDEVGTAMLASTCIDSDDSDASTGERTVYAFPDVSPVEAIVVVDGQGKHGTVYRSEAKPAAGWDPDFQD